MHPVETSCASLVQEEYLPEGSLKGARKGKRKLDGSQDLDSSYTADGDEPWPGSTNAEGANEHASKRHKVTRAISVKALMPQACMRTHASLLLAGNLQHC